MAERFVSSQASGTGDGTSPASPWTLLQAMNNASGDDVWIKADGPYLLGTIGVTTFAPAFSDNRFRGYLSVPGDLDYPAVVFDAEDAFASIAQIAVKNTLFENITCRNSSPFGVFPGVSITGSGCVVRRCRVTDVGAAGFVLDALGVMAVECEADGCSQLSSNFGAFELAAESTSARHGFAHDNNGHGFRQTTDTDSAAGLFSCIAASNAGAGFLSGVGAPRPLLVDQCVSVGNEDGFLLSLAQGAQIDCINCIIGNNTNGITVSEQSTSTVRAAGLARWGNTNAQSGGGSLAIRHFGADIALTNDPFISSSGPEYDFRLKPQFVELIGKGTFNSFIVGGQRRQHAFLDFGAAQQPPRPILNW